MENYNGYNYAYAESVAESKAWSEGWEGMLAPEDEDDYCASYRAALLSVRTGKSISEAVAETEDADLIEAELFLQDICDGLI